LAAAIAKLNMKFPRIEHAAPDSEQSAQDHVVQVADNAKLRAMSPVSNVAPEDAIVRAAPQVVSEVAPPTVAAAAENTSRRKDVAIDPSRAGPKSLHWAWRRIP